MIERLGLRSYFRAYAALVRASQWLADRAERSTAMRAYLRVLDGALLAPFYRARLLSFREAERLVSLAPEVVRARCICEVARGERGDGRCYYLGWAGEEYLRNGPHPDAALSAHEALAEIERADRAPGTHLMTVAGRARCVVFPREYVVCCCREAVCLPWSYAHRFPELSIYEPHPVRERSSIVPHVVAGLIGAPVALVGLGLYRAERGTPVERVGIPLLALLLFAGPSGAILSRPAMWPYLHAPGWSMNAHWTWMLPVGALLETAAVAGCIRGARAWRRRPSPPWSALVAATRAMVAFQALHLLRFGLTAVLGPRLPVRAATAFFWCWDPLAWVVLGLAVRRACALRSGRLAS